jgi:Fe-S-cluster containining protein
MTKFRPCEECTACCDGFLNHEVYGRKLGNGIPCYYLVEKKCTIYKDRPRICSSYQCAWSQHLLPEWMRPDKSGLLVNVEIDKNEKQFLKVIEMREIIEYDIYNEIEKFTKQNDTYWVKVPYKKVIPIKMINDI